MTRRFTVFTVAAILFSVLFLVTAGTANAGVRAHRKPQGTPMKVGTSGGNANYLLPDDAILPCRSGTLGGLVQDMGGVQYILSSNSVLAIDNDGTKGDPVIQPGLIDTKGGACNPANPQGHTVGDLSKYKKLKFGGIKNNKVNAALAEVRAGMVNPKGKVIGVGIPGSHVVAAFVGQQLKKSGPGTGVKRGTVIAVNATADVTEGFTRGRVARFVKQIIVQSNTAKPILRSRDQGSVFFEDTATCPGWVGLATAFSIPDGLLALVNKMSNVLSQLGKVRPKGSLAPVGCDSGAGAVSVHQSLVIGHDLREAERIQRSVEKDVLRLPGVIGIGIGIAVDNPDEVVFKILVEDDSETIRANVPEWLDDVRCEILETGLFSIG
jgi:hypothetical protein